MLAAIFGLIFLGCEKTPGIPESGEQLPEAQEDRCAWVFSAYEPSTWETEWLRGEESGERRDRECEILAQPEEVRRSALLVSAIDELVMGGKSAPSPEAIPLFSRMVYARHCGKNQRDTGQRRFQIIEPLVGILRDPLTICPKPPGVDEKVYSSFGPNENALQSKRFLLPGPLASWSDFPNAPESWRVGGFSPGVAAASGDGPACSRQKILVDIGASLYDGWGADASAVGAKWFVDRFKRRQLAFDRIISFEITKYAPDEIYRAVPDDVLPHYIYFNQGVEKIPNGRWNPWRILKGMSVTADDYVAVKLDIDVPDIENALIDQLLAEESIRRIVDEVYFEHHVNVRAMWDHWGHDTMQDSCPLLTRLRSLWEDGSSGTMQDSYQLFTRLRSVGVRMHSWP